MVKSSSSPHVGVGGEGGPGRRAIAVVQGDERGVRPRRHRGRRAARRGRPRQQRRQLGGVLGRAVVLRFGWALLFA